MPCQIDNELDKEKIISDLKTDFHFQVDDIAQPTTDNRIRGYESNYKQLIELFLNSVEFGTKLLTDSDTENKTTDQLNKIRNNDYSNYELTLLLKELSNNYEVDLLQSLLTDIEFYLFMEKEEKESNFTDNDIENAIQKLKENNTEIPYYKRKQIGELTARQKENRKKAEEKGLLFNPIIDKEQLLYPFEFYNIYRFKNLIKSKLKPKQTIEKKLITEINSENTLNWQGTTLEFSEFTKALIESGFIGKFKSEKEVFERMKQFFNVDDFDKSDKLKQVRNRTKELTPTINTLETSLTNWIKRKD